MPTGRLRARRRSGFRPVYVMASGGGTGDNNPIIFDLPLNDLGAGAVNMTPTTYRGSPTPTFTRATTAYTTLSTGLIAEVASGTARSTYSADGATYLGYLAEGARTNTCLQSQAFGTTWSAVTGSVSSNTTTAPDGTSTADSLIEPASGTSRGEFTQGSLSFTDTVVYSFSVFVKELQASPKRYFILGGSSNEFTGTPLVWVDALAGTITNTSGAALLSSSISDAGNGWFRVSFSATASATTALGAINLYITNSPTSANNYTCTGAGMYAWGAQIEVGSFASTYIPTTTVAVARNADIDQYVSASNLSASAMTMALTWTPEAAASMGTVFMFGTYVDASNYTAILHDGTNVIARKRIAGVNTDATKALTYVAGTSYRIVARFDGTNGIDVWVAGVKGTGSATLTASQIGTNFQIGADGNSLQQAFGAIKNFAVYGSGLSDTQAASL